MEEQSEELEQFDTDFGRGNEWKEIHTMKGDAESLIPRWLRFDIAITLGSKGTPIRGYKRILDLLEMHCAAGGYDTWFRYYDKGEKHWVRGYICKQGIVMGDEL